MTVKVMHRATGYIIQHENIEKVTYDFHRFELHEKRQKRGPICSTSYSNKLYAIVSKEGV